MAKNIIDVLKVIAGQIQNDELTSVVGASEPNEVEITDEGFESIQSQIGSLMTFESAVNNDKVLSTLIDKVNKEADSKVHKELKAKMLHSVEKRLEEFGGKVDLDLANKKAHDQIDILTQNISKFNQEPSGNDEKFTEEIGKLRKQLSTKDEEIKGIKDSHAKEFDDFKINAALRQKIDSFTLAEPYRDELVKNGIVTSIIDQAKSEAGFKIGPNGTIEVVNKDDPALELFDDKNKKVGIDELIDPKMQKFIQAAKEGTTVKDLPKEGEKTLGNNGSVSELLANAERI